ncbi:MAG: DUF4386 domain-containing protein [Chthoniobacterales bacterium]
MNDHSPQSSVNRQARAAGFFWLLTIVFGVFAFLSGGKFIVAGDAATTTANILLNELAFRLAGVSNLLGTICYLAVTVLIYELLRPLNRTAAVFGLIVSSIGCSLGAVSGLLFLAPVAFLQGAQAQIAFALLLMSLKANDMGLIFFGCHVLSIAYVIFTSSFVPRALGALLTLAGLAYLTNSFSSFLAFSFAPALMPVVGAAGVLGEGALTLWLLFKGINLQRWREQSAHSWTFALPQGAALLIFFCFASASTSVAQQNHDDLKHRVLQQAQSLSPDSYAFTRTVRSEQASNGKTEQKVTVEKYDPSKPAAARWTLVSEDGAPPSADSLSKYQKESAKRTVPGYYRLAKYFGAPATATTDSHGRTVFRFASVPKGSLTVMDSDVSENATIEASVTESNGTALAELVHVSIRPMRMKLVMKLNSYESTARYRLGADAKPILVEHTADMSGSGMGQEGSAHTVATYSDYRAVAGQR